MTSPFELWLLPEVAKEHNDLNSGYFESAKVGTYPHYYLLRDAFLQMIDKNKKMSCLDIGCGAGWQARYLYMEGLMDNMTYEGLDISQHMCDYANENFPQGTYYVGDVLDYNPEKTWDIVMACGSIEHFADWKVFLKKMAQLSSQWIIIHKIFFTDKPTWTLERLAYCQMKEIRVHLNYEEFSSVMKDLGFEITHRYDWSSRTVFGIVARRIK